MELIENKEANALARRQQNRLVLGTAVQLGVDILRELSETGGLGPDMIKSEPVEIEGVRTLLTSAITKELTTREGVKK